MRIGGSRVELRATGRWALIVMLAAMMQLFGPFDTALGVAGTSRARPCATGQLQVSLGRTGAGLGHESIAIVFRSRGATCTLRGFPTAIGVTSSGQVVRRARNLLKGYLPGADRVTTVTLAPGRAASALLEGLDPGFLSAPCQAYKFRTYTYLFVTPPADTHGVRLRLPTYAGTPWAFCDPQIHPVTTGRTGQVPSG
jgi:Protein of unknown function (DUF4232)